MAELSARGLALIEAELQKAKARRTELQAALDQCQQDRESYRTELDALKSVIDELEDDAKLAIPPNRQRREQDDAQGK